MRSMLLPVALAVAGFAITMPIAVAPASAQFTVDTPLGGLRVGPQPRHYSDYDRRYRAYGYDRGNGYDRGYGGRRPGHDRAGQRICSQGPPLRLTETC